MHFFDQQSYLQRKQQDHFIKTIKLLVYFMKPIQVTSVKINLIIQFLKESYFSLLTFIL